MSEMYKLDLGQATTRELLDEIAARVQRAHPEGLAYHAVGRTQPVCDEMDCGRPVAFISHVGGFHWCELHGMGRNASRISA